MTLARNPRRSRMAAVAVVMTVVTGLLVVTSPARAAVEDLITDNVVAINETISDAGFVHPGVGLSAEDLRNAQEMVRNGQEPWASYFSAMAATGAASTGYRAANSKSASQPDVALDPNFNHAGLRGRETVDSFGALTQSLMWVMTGNEVYRKNSIQALRTWASMNPDGFTYFADAHIHTGKPLSQFLMAAEIIRATDPLADATPGTQDGYDVIWSADDDERLLTNFANPLVEKFLYSNERWMNQHNFGLYGRIAAAIYADDAEAYATGVEWFTVNSTYDGYDNGSIAVQIPRVEADDPGNPYGEEFVYLSEMGRDQAHGETNVDNLAAMARFLEVQGTKVDPVHGTVSTTEDAVTAYEFLDNRLLEGANAFFGFMMGAPTPYTGEVGGGVLSQAYRGRMFNALNEVYYQYKYVAGVDVETEAPWVAELHERMDGPLFQYGTNVYSVWAAGDKSIEYWVAFPPELAGTKPTPVEDSAVSFGRHGLPIDEGTQIVTEDGATFARATADADGTMSVINRIMYPGGSTMGVQIRTDGPAVIEVLDKEEPDPRNEKETEPKVLSRIELPDTDGAWRYITYPAGGTNAHFFRVTGEGTTVDLNKVMFDAQKQLTPAAFEQQASTYYLWPHAISTFEFGATDGGGTPAYTAAALPDGAELDAETGALTWKPTPHDVGSHQVQITADDGEVVTTRTFQLVVAKNRPKMIDAVVVDGTDEDAVYTAVSNRPYQAALTAARDASESGSDGEFRTAFETLAATIRALELLNPRLPDGSFDYRNTVTPTVISATLANLVGDGHTGDLRVSSFMFDFGTQYRISAAEFVLQGPGGFGMRSQGTNVYGSNDGITWDLLTERETTNTDDMETIPVVAEHRGEEYRYLKLQLDHPGPPQDPYYPGIWTINEFRIIGDRSEVPGDITGVTMAAPDAVEGRVTNGDTVTVNLLSPTPVSDVAVTIGGKAADLVSPDQGTTWTATAEVEGLTGSGIVPITVDHTTANGTAATIVGTTDGKRIFGSDESNLIDLAGTRVIKADGSADAAKAAEAAAMLDRNAKTNSNIAPVDGQSNLIWDFGAGKRVTVDRLDYLARQNNNEGVRHMDDLVFEGSNDLSSWTTLTDPTFKTFSWQNLESSVDEGYRYLRVRNGMWLYVAELRLFGALSYDIETLLERADAVDLSAYTRGSQILFPREVAAVREALAEPDADAQALAVRLLDAWDLLSDRLVPATLEQSWVAASTVSWDGTRDAAANGWSMFDGNPGTFTDTTTQSCTNTVLPPNGTVFSVLAVKFLPRDNAVSRATGLDIQGSNDGGTTWTKFASTGHPARGWNTVTLADPVRFGALRVSGGSGHCNMAELQFIVEPIDKSGLAVHLDDAAKLNEADWTAESWAAIISARDAAQTVADDEAAAQEEVDKAADVLADAIAEAIAADKVKPGASLVVPTVAGPFSSLDLQVDAIDDRGLSKIVADVYNGDSLVKSTQLAVSDGARNASHVESVALPDGSYTLRYNAHDTAGNVSETGSFAFTIDATAPTATVKEGSEFTVATGQTYDKVSFKLHDAGKIAKVELNGVVKDLSDNDWSDINFVAPGVFGAVQGENTLIVYDVAGNTQTIVFTLN